MIKRLEEHHAEKLRGLAAEHDTEMEEMTEEYLFLSFSFLFFFFYLFFFFFFFFNYCYFCYAVPIRFLLTLTALTALTLFPSSFFPSYSHFHTPLALLCHYPDC